MRRVQNDKASQIIKNFAYDPSLQATGIATLIRTNNVSDPSVETAGATTAVRANILTNPSAETASGTVNVRTNLATNPSFEATSGNTNVRTNLVLNPSMETGSSTTTMRTNLAPNPNAVNSTGYFPVNGVSASLTTNQANGPVNSNTYARITATGGTTGMNYFGVAYGQPGASTSAQVSAGTTYTLSAYVRVTMTSFSVQPIIRLRYKDSGGTTLQDTSVSAVGAVSGQWVRITATALAPTNSAYIEVLGGYASIDQATITIGDTVDVSAILVESTNLMGNYFDGAIAASENLVKALTPTAQSNMTITTGISYSGFTWSRAATGTGSGSGIARQFITLTDLTPGETYTASVTVANDQAFSQAISIDWCDLNYNNVTLAPGEVRRIYTSGTKTVYDSTFRFSDLQVTQSLTEGRSILYKDFLVEKGTTTGEYFTGTGDFTYAWSGTANASTSVQRGVPVTYWTPATNATLCQSSTQKNVSGKSMAVFTKGTNGDGMYPSDISGITVGGSYTYSAWIKATTYTAFTVGFRWKDASAVTLTDTNVSVTATSGAWTRISATAVAPTGTVYLQPMLRIYASHTATVFYLDDVLIERASSLGTYFDGSIAASGDFTYAWASTANQSVSYQQAPTISTWQNRWFGNTGGDGALYQAKGGLSGTYARKLWTSANTGATQDAGINTPLMAVSSSIPYTLSVWVRCSVTQYLNHYISWRDSGGALISATQQATGTSIPANTWTRLSVTGTSPSNATQAYFILGPYAQAVAMPSGSTMDFDNVLIEAAPAVQPYFDGANTIQNLISNSSFETDLTGWTTSTNATQAQSATKAFTGVKSLATTVTVSGQATSLASTGASTNMVSVLEGYTYTFSAYLTGNSGATRQAQAIFYFRDASNNVIGSGTLGSLVNVDNVSWARPFVTAVAPAGAVKLQMNVNISTATAVANDVIYIDALVLDNSPTLSPYYTSTGDYSYVWAGTANASVSYQQAPGVAGGSSISSLGYGYQSKIFGITNGTKSFRITPVHATNGDSFLELAGMVGSYTFKANTSYTISGTRTILAAQTNINGTNGFRVKVGSTESTVSLISSVSNVAGSQRVVGRFATTSDVAGISFLRIYNGSFFGGGDVWWDDLVLEEGTTNGSYFDGTNPIQNLITNNSFETDTSGWAADIGAPTLTSDATFAWIGVKAMKMVSTTASADIAVRTNLTLLPCSTYTISWWVYSPDARTATVDVAATTSSWSISGMGSKAVPANTWTRVSATFTTPLSLAGSVGFYLHHGGGPTTIGTAMYIDAVLLERSPTLNPYYSGLGDFTYAWTGTTNASSSEQRASLPAYRQSVTVNSAVYQSSVRAFSGSKSGAIRVRNDVFVGGTLMYPLTEYTIGSGLTASVTNTWSLWVYVPSGSGTVRLEDATTSTIGNANTTFDKWERISVSFMGAVSGAHLIRLRAATTVPAGSVIWWDNELLEAAPAVGSYFDGSTAATSDLTNSWNGTANAAPSWQKVNIPSTLVAAKNNTVDSKFYGYVTADPAGKKIARWFSPAGSSNSTWRIAGFNGTAFDYSSIRSGGNYTLMFRYQSSGWTAGGTINVALQDSNGTNSVTPSATSFAVNASGWQEYRRTFTAQRDATSSTILYLTLPNTPSVSADGVFDLRDWMIVPGEYTGDFIHGGNPFSKWDGTANSSTSRGYAPHLLDIAGKPELDVSTIGSTALPGGYGTSDARTFYTVFHNLNKIPTNGSVEQIVLYGPSSKSDTVSNTYMTLRIQNSAQTGNGLLSRRTGGGGPIEQNSPVGINVACWGMDINGYLFVVNNNGTLNTDAVAMSVTHDDFTVLADTANRKYVRTIMYRGFHDAPTRQAVSRYLGNKYGAYVA